MFYQCEKFNQDIGDWDVGLVYDMSYMFNRASEFIQDLSRWCVRNVSESGYFDTNAGFEGQDELLPKWGTCPGDPVLVEGTWIPDPTTICTEKVQYTPGSKGDAPVSTRTERCLWEGPCCGAILGGVWDQGQIDQLVLDSTQDDYLAAAGCMLSSGEGAQFRIFFSEDAYYLYTKSDNPMDREYRKGPPMGVTVKLQIMPNSNCTITTNGETKRYGPDQSFSTSVSVPDGQDYVDVDMSCQEGRFKVLYFQYTSRIIDTGGGKSHVSYWINEPQHPRIAVSTDSGNPYADETPLDLKYKFVNVTDTIDGSYGGQKGYSFNEKRDNFNAIRTAKLGEPYGGCPALVAEVRSRLADSSTLGFPEPASEPGEAVVDASGEQID